MLTGQCSLSAFCVCGCCLSIFHMVGASAARANLGPWIAHQSRTKADTSPPKQLIKSSRCAGGGSCQALPDLYMDYNALGR